MQAGFVSYPEVNFDIFTTLAQHFYSEIYTNPSFEILEPLAVESQILASESYQCNEIDVSGIEKTMQGSCKLVHFGKEAIPNSSFA